MSLLRKKITITERTYVATFERNRITGTTRNHHNEPTPEGLAEFERIKRYSDPNETPFSRWQRSQGGL